MDGMRARVLVVDDDPALAEMLTIVLRGEGFDTAVVRDGSKALDAFREVHPDLVLLDLMLPGMSGLDVCKEIRAESGIPIIMLTAKTDTVDVVLGLESGADDYVMKPFKPKELTARIRARLRRADVGSAERLRVADVEVDVPGHQVTRDGEPISLTPLEFDLLVALARKPRQVFTREVLLEQVWGYRHAADTRLVNVHVQRLRSKIEKDPEHPEVVVTVRGVDIGPARRDRRHVHDAGRGARAAGRRGDIESLSRPTGRRRSAPGSGVTLDRARSRIVVLEPVAADQGRRSHPVAVHRRDADAGFDPAAADHQRPTAVQDRCGHRRDRQRRQTVQSSLSGADSDPSSLREQLRVALTEIGRVGRLVGGAGFDGRRLRAGDRAEPGRFGGGPGGDPADRRHAGRTAGQGRAGPDRLPVHDHRPGRAEHPGAGDGRAGPDQHRFLRGVPDLPAGR